LYAVIESADMTKKEDAQVSGMDVFFSDCMDDTFKSELIIELLKGLPNPAQLYAPDGNLIMANPAFIEVFSIDDPDELLEKYNILNDPTAKAAPFYEKILRAFSGETTQSQDVVIPIHIVKSANNISGCGINSLIADISTVPICKNGNLLYVANFLYIKRKLTHRKEIDMAKVYIETHWLDKFDIDAVAGEACLSVSHFSHIFKAYTGLTPHCYYINIKIEKIKDNLLNMDLSVDEAFSECGVDYHGYYAALFKKKTGFSPSEYRKMALK